MDQYEALKYYFGHSQFRQGQEALIDAILSGRDVLGIMPTGGGKSLCYQIPALVFDGRHPGHLPPHLPDERPGSRAQRGRHPGRVF